MRSFARGARRLWIQTADDVRTSTPHLIKRSVALVTVWVAAGQRWAVGRGTGRVVGCSCASCAPSSRRWRTWKSACRPTGRRGSARGCRRRRRTSRTSTRTTCPPRPTHTPALRPPYSENPPHPHTHPITRPHPPLISYMCKLLSLTIYLRTQSARQLIY